MWAVLDKKPWAVFILRLGASCSSDLIFHCFGSSWHASCALSGSRLFIHGGYNGNVALDDSFIFCLGKSCARLNASGVVTKFELDFS
jgi:hypothetical protein